jgi:hypothetical protein
MTTCDEVWGCRGRILSTLYPRRSPASEAQEPGVVEAVSVVRFLNLYGCIGVGGVCYVVLNFGRGG